MSDNRIIVVGASAGGVESLRALVSSLPADLNASIFVVLHLPVTSASALPQILSRTGPFEARHPKDGEEIKPRRVYVAPPDHHLLVERGRIAVKKGPKENRFRPSIDALFRSAAYVYGPNVIGIVLSGMLDDGTSGLWSVKRMGGVSIVQDPKTAPFDSMPLSALKQVDVDHVVDADDIGPLLKELISRPLGKPPKDEKDLHKRMEAEIGIAASGDAFKKGIMELGDLTPFTCPECHGALVSLKEGLHLRYRCHTGHAYTANALLGGVMEKVDEYNWQHMRALEEAVMLMRHMGDHLYAGGDSKMADLYYAHADQSDRKAQDLRKTTLEHENLSGDRLRAHGEGGGKSAIS
jgi:two-component system, chemotaxis family, protein-glutamate methylesterase/glutaminase